MSIKQKILVGVLASTVVFGAISVATYTSIIPALVRNQKVIDFVQDKLLQYSGLELQIQNPILKTGFSSTISFSADAFQLSKNDDMILSAQNFATVFSVREMVKKKILLKKFGADYSFVDINKVMALAPEKNVEEQKPSDWKVDWYQSDLYLKNSIINYKLDDKTFLKVDTDNLELNTAEIGKKHLHFKVNADLKVNGRNLNFKAEDRNRVYIENRKINVDNCEFDVNKSKLFLSAVADEANNFDLKVSSKNFQFKDVVDLINSGIVENNLNETLAYFSDINGNFDFGVNITNNDINGDINLNKLSFKLIPVANIPVLLTSGKIKITKDTVNLNGFKGIYNNRLENKLDFQGTVRDYLKSVDTDIVANAVVTNDFSKNYFSKMVGYPIQIIGKPNTRLIFKSKYNKMDMIWLFKFLPDEGFMVDKQDLTPAKLDRVLAAHMHFEDMFLNLKSLNYYMERHSTEKKTRIPDPILTMNGNIDLHNGTVVKDFGFEIPKPLPSEFLNMMLKQDIFKKGTIAGKLSVDLKHKYPVLDGRLVAEGVRIPSQRLGIKKGEFYTDANTIHLVADGGYRRVRYNFDGDIQNQIKLPIVVKNVDLTLDNLDVEKVLNTFNSQPVIADTSVVDGEHKQEIKELSDDEDVMTFDIGNVIVENSSLKINKGSYKEMEFGNVVANMTLDKDSNLLVTSNRFDIAEGISTLKINCNLKKQEYATRLGILDVNSNTIAKTLLNLDKEISGKAKGLIELNTDKSMKLNGSIKFAIEQGTIEKIGFVEYIMKIASLFRNPLVMITPGTIADLTNIPSGDFDRITGELKIDNNIVKNINIKSASSALSALIVGRFDLETRDATLRIYTKFSNKKKGVYGALRNLSLNALANRIPLITKNDSNYYASELEQIPAIDADEKDCQVFLTKVDGDVENNNFISSLKKIK